MIELSLKIGANIKWRDSYSSSMKKGRIVKIIRDYCTSDKAFCYGVIDSDTGNYYTIKEKDITMVLVDCEWVDYKQIKISSGYYRSSERYPWECNSIKNFIDKTVNDYDESCHKAAAHGYIISFKPKKVVFNGPATVVLWKDGTKTIVKRREGEQDDREKAVMYCILKKLCGNKASMDRYLKLFLNEEKEEKADSSSEETV